MKAQCTSDLNYIPGDDSPLYTVFPTYESKYSSTSSDHGTLGYIEANNSLVVKAASDCKSLELTYATKSSIIMPTNVKHTMIFKVESYRNGELSVSSVEKQPYRCDMGICGKFTDTKRLTLAKSGRTLKLNSVTNTRGILYAFPFRKTEKTLSCSFVQN